MRKPVAMGFYPHDALILGEIVKKFLFSREKMANPLGAVMPHAGYAFSGEVAGATLRAAKTEKRNFIIFCPNHSGYGSEILASTDEWQTPLGVVRPNRSMIKEIIDNSPIEVGEDAHRYEHSAEVQLPFLQVLYGRFTVVPICLGHAGIDQLKGVTDILASFHKSSFYIASSDFIHFGPVYGYEPVGGPVIERVNWARKRDEEMIDMICKLDAEGFYDTVTENNYTVCGVVPITLLLLVLRKIGAKKGKLIKYMSSYDKHPDDSFVGYAGIAFE